MKKIKLAVKDLKLIYELEKDSRASLSQIAKNIGTSKEVANYRFNQLIHKNVITKFVPIIDYFSLGFECYRILINLYNLKKSTKDKIVKKLRKIERTKVIVLLQSHWDIEINIWVKDASEFYKFYNNLIEKFSDYIQSKEFSLITKMYFLKHAYLYKKQEPIIFEETNKIEIDKEDYKIINFLERGARSSLIKMAEELNFPVSTLNYRVKSLYSKGIIKSVMPQLNISLLEYDRYKIQITLNDTSKKKILIEYLSNKKNVTKILEFIGKADLEFEVDFKTALELDNFLSDLRTDIPYVKDFEVMIVLKK